MFLENTVNHTEQFGWIEVICGSMFSGKTEELIRRLKRAQFAKQRVEIFKPAVDTRYDEEEVVSHNDNRIRSTPVPSSANIRLLANDVDVVGIDEAQFLTKEQVRQLTDIVDIIGIPVLAYGIRTDFLGETFTGSAALLAWADKLVELKTICHCGKKAGFVTRVDEHGNAAIDGEQIEIGGNERYEVLCRKHFKELVWHNQK